MVEQLIRNQQVESSILSGSSKTLKFRGFSDLAFRKAAFFLLVFALLLFAFFSLFLTATCANFFSQITFC